MSLTRPAADGVEVHASEVVAPPTPGKSFAIIDHNCCVPPVFTESACARALQFQPNTVLHFSPSMTPGVQTAVEFCPLAVHVGVWGAAVEMSSMCAGKSTLGALHVASTALRRPCHSKHAVSACVSQSCKHI
jgi:hypothetical protein